MVILAVKKSRAPSGVIGFVSGLLAQRMTDLCAMKYMYHCSELSMMLRLSASCGEVNESIQLKLIPTNLRCA
ncbi:hypothetical protein Nepgr_015979 [Nepenthes gracilis]|uniref:Uncharacterized protein n=1 Tax=Nepenthes gracilis TaxID=150966 RepID=A0AAD3SMP0_NEPGR|nr:hypothetical protein Nepgr_015979 [Nepenthes gracilis]